MSESQETNGAQTRYSALDRRYSALARVARLARKELREILRDRRTIMTLIAMLAHPDTPSLFAGLHSLHRCFR